MPLYEYQCQTCKHQQEKLESMHAERTQTCPSCNQPTLQRIMSNTHFQLKGSGWYVTDFKKPQTNTDTTEAASETSSRTEEIEKNQGKNQENNDQASRAQPQTSRLENAAVSTKQNNNAPAESSNKSTATSNTSSTD